MEKIRLSNYEFKALLSMLHAGISDREYDVQTIPECVSTKDVQELEAAKRVLEQLKVAHAFHNALTITTCKD